MITHEDVKLVENWATTFVTHPTTPVAIDDNEGAFRYVHQIDPTYWRHLAFELDQLANRMKEHLALSDVGEEISMDSKDETPTVTYNGKPTDPYFVKWGEKIVTHLEQLDVMRRLSAKDREAVSAYLGALMESQANSHFELGRSTARLDMPELMRQKLEEYLYGR